MEFLFFMRVKKVERPRLLRGFATVERCLKGCFWVSRCVFLHVPVCCSDLFLHVCLVCDVSFLYSFQVSHHILQEGQVWESLSR